MKSHQSTNNQVKFQQLIQSIQQQFTELLAIQSTHPEPARFKHVIVKIITHLPLLQVFLYNETEAKKDEKIKKARDMLKGITLDPLKLNINDIDIPNYSSYLQQNKLKHFPPVANPSPLLHEDKAIRLLHLGDEVICMSKELEEPQRQELVKFDIIKRLHKLNFLTTEFVNLVWTTPARYTYDLHSTFGCITETNGGMSSLLHRKDDEIATFLITNFFKQPRKSELLRSIYQTLKENYRGFSIPIIVNLEKILPLSLKQIKALRTRLNIIRMIKPEAETNLNQRVFDIMLNDALSPEHDLAEARINQLYSEPSTESIEEKSTSENESITFTIKTSDLKETLLWMETWDKHCEKISTNEYKQDASLDQLKTLIQANSETINVSTSQLYDLVWNMSFLENGYISDDDKEGKKIRADIIEAHLMEKMFGSERARYLKHTWKNNMGNRTAYMSAFIIEPAHLDYFSKRFIFRPSSLFVLIMDSFSWCMDIAGIQILKPYIETQQDFLVAEIAKSLYWLAEYQLLTPESASLAIRNIYGMNLLTNLKFSTKYSDFDHSLPALAEKLYKGILPLVIEKHQQVFASGVKPEPVKLSNHITLFDNGRIELKVGGDDSDNEELEEKKITIPKKPTGETANPHALKHIATTIKPKNEARIQLDNGMSVIYKDTEIGLDYSIYDGDTLALTLHDSEATDLLKCFPFGRDHLVTFSNYQSEDIGWGNGCYRFKIWDLVGNRCVRTLDAGHTSELVSSHAIANNRFLMIIGNNAYIHTTHHLEQKFKIETLGKVVNAIPTGYLIAEIDDDRNESLVIITADKEHRRETVIEKIKNSDNYFILDNHSILHFSNQRAQQTLRDGENNEFNFPAITHLYRYDFDKIQNKYTCGDKQVLATDVPAAIHDLGNNIILLEIKKAIYAADLSATTLNLHCIRTQPRPNPLKKRAPFLNAGNKQAISSISNKSTLLINDDGYQLHYQIQNLKQFIKQEEQLAEMKLAGHGNSLWNQRDESKTETADFASVMQVRF